MLFEVAYTYSQLQFQNKFLLLLRTQTSSLIHCPFHHKMFHPIVMAFDIVIRLDQATQGIELLTYVLLLGFFVVQNKETQLGKFALTCRV